MQWRGEEYPALRATPGSAGISVTVCTESPVVSRPNLCFQRVNRAGMVLTSLVASVMLGFMRIAFPTPALLLVAIGPYLCGLGCSSRVYFDRHSRTELWQPRKALEAAAAPRSLPMFTSEGGAAISWQDLLHAIDWADVVILGEQHDDAVGHALQLAVVEDAVLRFPGTALSMEMLDREEQALVDDYLADFINRDMFLEQTASTKWLRIARDYLDDEIDRETFQKRILRIGWPDWENNYQPIIDAAKAAGSPVVAANTPWLRYMSVANREGYDRLRSLTDAQKRLFARPKRQSYKDYRERFWQVMVGRAEGEPPPPLEEDAEDDAEARHMQMTDEQVRNAFRGQLIMDATMADSIANALRDGAKKVVHLVGQFHSDFDGGTVQELRRRKRGVKILTVSMQRADATALREEDRGRADIVIYTGKPDEPEDEETDVALEDAAPAPTTQPTTQPTSQPTTRPATTQPTTRPTTRPTAKPDDDSF